MKSGTDTASSIVEDEKKKRKDKVHRATNLACQTHTSWPWKRKHRFVSRPQTLVCVTELADPQCRKAGLLQSVFHVLLGIHSVHLCICSVCMACVVWGVGSTHTIPECNWYQPGLGLASSRHTRESHKCLRSLQTIKLLFGAQNDAAKQAPKGNSWSTNVCNLELQTEGFSWWLVTM